jgi:hypothetical protein
MYVSYFSYLPYIEEILLLLASPHIPLSIWLFTIKNRHGPRSVGKIQIRKVGKSDKNSSQKQVELLLFPS